MFDRFFAEHSSQFFAFVQMALNSKFRIPSARELFKSIPNAKRDWKLKTPFEKWCYLYGIGKAPLHVLRVPAYKENINDVHWFAYLVYLYTIGTPLLSLYTIGYYSYRGELEQSLKSTCLATICLAVCNQIISLFVMSTDSYEKTENRENFRFFEPIFWFLVRISHFYRDFFLVELMTKNVFTFKIFGLNPLIRFSDLILYFFITENSRLLKFPNFF